MSQNIINPDRRDPSKIRNRADIGLSHVDNVGVSEILDLAKDLTKDEVCRGDRYAEQELIEGVDFEIPLCNFTSDSTKVSITISFLYKDVVYSIVTARVFHTYDTSVSDRFTIEFDLVGNIVLSDSDLVSFYFYEDSTAKQANLSIVCNGKLLNRNYKITSVSYHFSDYVVVSGDKSDVPGFTKLTQTSIRTGDRVGSLMSGNIKRQIYNLRFSDRKLSSFTRSLPVYSSSDNTLVYKNSLIINNEDDRKDYSFPTINNVAFTGSSEITVYNNNITTATNTEKRSTRNIVITAQHSGTDKDSAGTHEWDVLENIPVNTNINTIEYKTPTEIKNSNAGLCTLVSSTNAKPSINTNDAVQKKINDLKKWTDNLNNSQAASVITVDFLKSYTELLSNILTDLTIKSAETSVSFGKPKISENSLTLDGAVYSYLGASPTPGKYVNIGIQTVLPNNKEIKIYFETADDNPYSLGVYDYSSLTEASAMSLNEDGSLSFTSSFSVEEGSSNLSKTEIRAFKIITNNKLDYSEDYLLGKSFNLKVSSVKKGENDEEILEELISIGVNQKILNESNSIFLNSITKDYKTIQAFSTTVFTRVLYTDLTSSETINAASIESLMPSDPNRKKLVSSSLFKNISDYSNGLLSKKINYETINDSLKNTINTEYEVLLPPTAKKDIIIEGFSVYSDFSLTISCENQNPVDTISFYVLNEGGTELKRVGEEINISGTEKNQTINIQGLFDISPKKEEIFDYEKLGSIMSWTTLEDVNNSSEKIILSDSDKDNQVFFIKIKSKNNSNLIDTINSGFFKIIIDQGTQKTILNLKQRCCPYIISVPENYKDVWSYGLSSPKSYYFEKFENTCNYKERENINDHSYLLNTLLVKLKNSSDNGAIEYLNNINELSDTDSNNSLVKINYNELLITPHLGSSSQSQAIQNLEEVNNPRLWPAELYCYNISDSNKDYYGGYDRNGTYLILYVYENIDTYIDASKNASNIKEIKLILDEYGLDKNHFNEYKLIYPPEILPYELTNDFKQIETFSNNDSQVSDLGERAGFIGLQNIGDLNYPQRRNTVSFHLTYMGLTVTVPNLSDAYNNSWGAAIFPISNSTVGGRVLGLSDGGVTLSEGEDLRDQVSDRFKQFSWDNSKWPDLYESTLPGGWGCFEKGSTNIPEGENGSSVYFRLGHYIIRVGCGYELSPSFDVVGDEKSIIIKSELKINNNANYKEDLINKNSDSYKYTTDVWDKYNNGDYRNTWPDTPEYYDGKTAYTFEYNGGDETKTYQYYFEETGKTKYKDRVKNRSITKWTLTRNIKLKELEKNKIYKRPLGIEETYSNSKNNVSENWRLLSLDNGSGLYDVGAGCNFNCWDYQNFYEKYIDRLIFFPEFLDKDGNTLADEAENKVGTHIIRQTQMHFLDEDNNGWELYKSRHIDGLERYVPRLKCDYPMKPLDMTLTLRFYYSDGKAEYPIDVQGTSAEGLGGIIKTGVFNNELIYEFRANPGYWGD